MFSQFIYRVVTDSKRLRTEKVLKEWRKEKAKKAALSQKFENEPLISPKLM